MNEYSAVQDIVQLIIWTIILGAVVVLIAFLYDRKRSREREDRVCGLLTEIRDALKKPTPGLVEDDDPPVETH